LPQQWLIEAVKECTWSDKFLTLPNKVDQLFNSSV
jgi:hypothetical protein